MILGTEYGMLNGCEYMHIRKRPCIPSTILPLGRVGNPGGLFLPGGLNGEKCALELNRRVSGSQASITKVNYISRCIQYKKIYLNKCIKYCKTNKLILYIVGSIKQLDSLKMTPTEEELAVKGLLVMILQSMDKMFLIKGSPGDKIKLCERFYKTISCDEVFTNIFIGNM